MRRKNRKIKQDDSETNTSDKGDISEVEKPNEESHDEDEENSLDTQEPGPKKRKSEKKVSFSPKKSKNRDKEKYKDKDDDEDKEKENSHSNSDIDNGEAQYEVEFIVDEKTVKGMKHYLIRWKGFSEDSDTWEPENILSCPELIKQFRANRKNDINSQSKRNKDSKKKTPKKKDAKDDVISEWDENEEFEIDRIVEVHHKRDGKREFLVSWKGYPQSQNSWVLEEDMTCNDLIAKFMAKVEKAKETEQKTLRAKPAHTERFTLSTPETGRRLSKRNYGKQRVQYHDAE